MSRLEKIEAQYAIEYIAQKMHSCEETGCKCPITIPRTSNILPSTLYEIQTDTYKCGPVAILNALHFHKRSPGRALRRSIITNCKTAEIHPDGFRGTKPEHFAKVIQYLWSSHKHCIGIDACASALRRHKHAHAGYVLLYSYARKHKQYYHYIFLHQIHDGSVYLVNDGTLDEHHMDLSSFITSHLALEGSYPVQYPQLWVL